MTERDAWLKPTLFVELTTEELLEMAKKTDKVTPWHKYDRAMLLAFFHNRYGATVPVE